MSETMGSERTDAEIGSAWLRTMPSYTMWQYEAVGRLVRAARALVDVLHYTCGPHPAWATEWRALRAALGDKEESDASA